MVRTRRESHHHDGITDPKDLQLPFATKSAQSGHGHRTQQCPLLGGGFNGSTQHLLILLEEEVCDGGDCTDMVHAAAEG